MSNYDLHLVVDWSTFENGPFYGHFTSKQWVVTGDGPTRTISDFIAGDFTQGDTLTFSLAEANGLAVCLKQMVVIFTKELGAGTEPDSPFNWTDSNHSNTTLLGMIIFTANASGGQPLPITGLGADSVNFTSYPPTPSGGTLFSVANNATAAFEATFCAEIWDDNTPPYRAFFTHDPSMDVTADTEPR
jgi:hypothetical protein